MWDFQVTPPVVVGCSVQRAVQRGSLFDTDCFRTSWAGALGTHQMLALGGLRKFPVLPRELNRYVDIANSSCLTALSVVTTQAR